MSAEVAWAAEFVVERAAAKRRRRLAELRDEFVLARRDIVAVAQEMLARYAAQTAEIVAASLGRSPGGDAADDPPGEFFVSAGAPWAELEEDLSLEIARACCRADLEAALARVNRIRALVSPERTGVGTVADLFWDVDEVDALHFLDDSLEDGGRATLEAISDDCAALVDRVAGRVCAGWDLSEHAIPAGDIERGLGEPLADVVRAVASVESRDAAVDLLGDWSRRLGQRIWAGTAAAGVGHSASAIWECAAARHGARCEKVARAEAALAAARAVREMAVSVARCGQLHLDGLRFLLAVRAGMAAECDPWAGGSAPGGSAPGTPGGFGGSVPGTPRRSTPPSRSSPRLASVAGDLARRGGDVFSVDALHAGIVAVLERLVRPEVFAELSKFRLAP